MTGEPIVSARCSRAGPLRLRAASRPAMIIGRFATRIRSATCRTAGSVTVANALNWIGGVIIVLSTLDEAAIAGERSRCTGPIGSVVAIVSALAIVEAALSGSISKDALTMGRSICAWSMT